MDVVVGCSSLHADRNLLENSPGGETLLGQARGGPAAGYETASRDSSPSAITSIWSLAPQVGKTSGREPDVTGQVDNSWGESMHVPTVTDEMLEKVIEAAASPVFLVLFEADSGASSRLRKRVESVADEFDDRVIFLALNVDENPSPAKTFGLDEYPAIVTLKRSREVGRAVGDIGRESIEELLERAITAEA